MLLKDLVSVTPGVETPEGCQKICQVKFALRELHFHFSGAELFYLSKLWVCHWGIGNTTVIPFLSKKCAFCCVFLGPENFISDTFKTTGPRQWQILSITISISDKPQARQGWCTFYSALLHRERKNLAYFDQFWLFCCKFTHFHEQGSGVPNIRYAKVDRLGRKIDHILYKTSFNTLRAFLKLGLCAARLYLRAHMLS